MISSWLSIGLGAISVFSDVVFAKPGIRIGGSPGYKAKEDFPERCSISGPNPGNWSLSYSLDQTKNCKQTQFFDFSIYDPVDDSSIKHQIYSCFSYGPDWTNFPNATDNVVPATNTNVTYQFGASNDGHLASSYVSSVSKQIRKYISGGYGATNKSMILYAHFGLVSAGIYIGKGLQNEGTSLYALQAFENNVKSLDKRAGTVAMQFCELGIDGDHIFGFMATSNSTFASIQAALQSWSNSTCLSFNNTTNITGPAYFTTSLFLNLPQNITMNSTITAVKNATLKATSKPSSAGRLGRNERLQKRDGCTYTQVASGDGCFSLAQKCGISSTQFTHYNPLDASCGPTTFQPGQYVCCSPGTLPDLSPHPNADGSCASYTVQSGDNCALIAAANDITQDQLNAFNTNTWGWTGCTPLGLGNICLSTGTPPLSAPVANALCGPAVPGTLVPPSGTDVSTLNPCPLNACCDKWGQCGTTAEFCTDTRPPGGAPGTAAAGTNGCVSNCGMDIVSSGPPTMIIP